MANKQKLFIDLCGGIDHAVALWYALHAQDVEVVGVSCSDPRPERGSSLVKKCVEAAQPGADIPVASGSSPALFGASLQHGQSGGQQQQAAARLLVQLANTYRGELTVVTLGRLTHLAKAVAIDPRLPEKLKRVVIQGGAIRVPGNVTPIAEANLHVDPEAAAFVWAAGLPLSLVPLDATERLRLTPEESRGLTDKAVRLGAAPAGETHGEAAQEEIRMDAWGAMVAALHMERVHKQQMKLTIECRSPLSRGAVLADLRAKPSVGTDTEVIVNVEAGDARKWLQELIGKEGGLQ